MSIMESATRLPYASPATGLTRSDE